MGEFAPQIGLFRWSNNKADSTPPRTAFYLERNKLHPDLTEYIATHNL